MCGRPALWHGSTIALRFGSYLTGEIMLCFVAKKRGPGRPKHKDDPPVILATTIPKSLDRALRE